MEGYGSPAEIGERIAELRRRRGWARRQLAERIGLDPHAVERIELGRRGLTARDLRRLSQALGAPAEAILATADPEMPMLRVGGATEQEVAAGLEVLERAARTFFAAERLAEFL